MPARRSRGLSRREFVKAAVAIGGSAALSACLAREDPDLPQGPDDPSPPARQHAWNDALDTDEHGNPRPPRHHVLLYLDYVGEGEPDDADRETVERALGSLERAYPRSHDGEVGLLFTMGYSPSYFERFDADLPDSVDLPDPEALASFEDPGFDDPDAVVHLASDYGSVVLAVPEVLLGEADRLNGRETDATFEGVFELADLGDAAARRAGFVGEGLPADNQDVDGIPDSEPVPEDSPLYMGFESGFEKSQATEDRVTISEGPFAGGATQHVSRIRLQLQQWYEQDSREQRESLMFCPAHAENDRIEGTGQNLGNDHGVADECADDVTERAREHGTVGHTQKTARVREDGRPVILRRDFDSTDGGEAAVHFVSLQEGIADFTETRAAMNGEDVAEESAVGQRVNNGILQYMSVERRGNYLLPPRELRALPTPRP